MFSFCFVFAFIESTVFRSLICLRFGSPTQLATVTTVCVLFSFFFGDDVTFTFYQVLCTIAISSLYGEYVVRFPSGWCFLACDHELDFESSSIYQDSINQSDHEYSMLLVV